MAIRAAVSAGHRHHHWSDRRRRRPRRSLHCPPPRLSPRLLPCHCCLRQALRRVGQDRRQARGPRCTCSLGAVHAHRGGTACDRTRHTPPGCRRSGSSLKEWAGHRASCHRCMYCGQPAGSRTGSRACMRRRCSATVQSLHSKYACSWCAAAHRRRVRAPRRRRPGMRLGADSSRWAEAASI